MEDLCNGLQRVNENESGKAWKARQPETTQGRIQEGVHNTFPYFLNPLKSCTPPECPPGFVPATLLVVNHYTN